MTATKLKEYVSLLKREIQLDRYIPRHFAAAEASGSLPADFEYRFHGMLREGQPQLDGVLVNPRLLILGEPGAGKSIVAKAATLELISRNRVSIFAELKEYRGSLERLFHSVPTDLLDLGASVDGVRLQRAYVLDGVDEVPAEWIDRFSEEIALLADKDRGAQIVLTARQAFYVSNRARFPDIPAVFHILDFSDEDIHSYVEKSGLSPDSFLTTVRSVDAEEEIRNPFILSVIVDRFLESGSLGDRKSKNLSYMIERLIQSRPRFDSYWQRRALQMIGVAMETYARNELTEDEALLVMKAAMHISDQDARGMLDELYASILKRTGNGLAFQSRSFGEYLAAEALHGERLERVRELAFVDYKTPNDSWLNAISYLAELNEEVRRFFVRWHPLWMIHASPSAFTPAEKDTIISGILKICVAEKQHITEHPQVRIHKLARFVTENEETRLVRDDLQSPDCLVRGNALVLLGIRKRPEVLPAALQIVKDRSAGTRLRYCALVAVLNAGGPEHVNELLPLLDSPDDPLDINLTDMVGGIISEAQIPLLLPRILHTNAMLSATYYRFREFRSRDALIVVLKYLIANPRDLNSIRAEGYVEPILRLIERYWDEEIANLCVGILEVIETQGIYLDRSGPLRKFFEHLRSVDRRGLVSRLYFDRALAKHNSATARQYFVDEILAFLMTEEAAMWLVEKQASVLIRRIAPQARGKVREVLRPHSDGIIDAHDANIRAYREEDDKKGQARRNEVRVLQERLLTRTTLLDALRDFLELSKDHWPELPADYRNWLTGEISRQMVELDLERSVKWDGNTLWRPRVLDVLLDIIDRYELRLEDDAPLVFAAMGWTEEEIAKYHRRFGFSQAAIGHIERLLSTPLSTSALQGIVRLLRETGIFTADIGTALRRIVSDPSDQGYLQLEALDILAKNAIDDNFLEQIEARGASLDLKRRAFEVLVERQHRPVIERSLARLLSDHNEVKAGEVGFPETSPLTWIGKIRAPFAWDKLVQLREKTLRLELPQVGGIVTETLANMNRRETAQVIRRQVSVAPASWRVVQVSHALKQEQQARIEEAQRTPFGDVLRKLKGATSINRLKLLCEGSTDIPVFKALIAQVPDTPEIILDDVGGWAGLPTKNPNNLLLGCKEAILVMDGDRGRNLRKPGKPFTKLAKQERKRLSNFPIEFHVLERYGIENYFPRAAMETTLGRDLAAYFPIPDHVAVFNHFSEEYRTLSFRVERFLAWVFRRQPPAATRSLYPKSRNGEVALLTSLDRNLAGTDLATIVLRIGQRAKELAAE